MTFYLQMQWFWWGLTEQSRIYSGAQMTGFEDGIVVELHYQPCWHWHR